MTYNNDIVMSTNILRQNIYRQKWRRRKKEANLSIIYIIQICSQEWMIWITQNHNLYKFKNKKKVDKNLQHPHPMFSFSIFFFFFLTQIFMTLPRACVIYFFSRYGFKIRGNEFVETAQTRPSTVGPTYSAALTMPSWTRPTVKVLLMRVAALDCS